MSRLEVAVKSRKLLATGDVLLRIELNLEIKSNSGAWKIVNFLVDSGTEITTFPARLAKTRDLPMPQRPTRHAIHAQTGLEVRSGLLRIRIVGMDQTEYALPCFFLGDPNVPPHPFTYTYTVTAPTGVLDMNGVSGIIFVVQLCGDPPTSNLLTPTTHSEPTGWNFRTGSGRSPCGGIEVLWGWVPNPGVVIAPGQVLGGFSFTTPAGPTPFTSAEAAGGNNFMLFSLVDLPTGGLVEFPIAVGFLGDQNGGASVPSLNAMGAQHPEPASWALFALGLLGLLGSVRLRARWRRRTA